MRSARALTHKVLNGRLLWAHCLSLKKHGTNAPVEVADACCGIQSQSLPDSLSSFWARIDYFTQDKVLSELRPGRSLVRTWAIRSTLHIVPSKDYHTYLLGGASERLLNWIDTIAKKRNYLPRDKRRTLLYEPLLDEIKGRSVNEEEIRRLVDKRAVPLGMKKGIWSGIGEMGFLGLLVHAGKQGSKRLWIRSDEWIPRLGKSPDVEKCRTELIRKYIDRHGPVSKDDIMYWAYLPRKQLDQTLANLEDDLVRTRINGSKEEYFSLDQNTVEDFPTTPKVILLPRYDSLLLSLKDKSRFMNMAYYKWIFPKLPVGMVKPTVLVDGYVAGTWRKVVKGRKGVIEVHSLRKISTRDRRAVEDRLSEYCRYAGLGTESKVIWAAN